MQSCEVPSMCLRVSRAFRSPRSHTLSRLDNSGTLQEVVAISIVDNHEFQAPVRSSCFCRWLLKHSDHLVDLIRQLIKARVIGRWKYADDDVVRFHCRKNLQPYKLTQSAAQLVSLHDRMTVLTNNYSGSRIRKQGVVGPNVEMFGTQSSPCSLHLLQI